MKKIFLFALTVLLSTMMYAQKVTVSGTVTSKDDSQPVPGANVQVKGTKIGAFTDDNGKYSIANVPANATLVFSSIGFTTQEVAVSGRGVINVQLSADAMALDETIVVAYGTAKKGTYTGAAAVVKNDAIKDVPTASFENALNGKVAGLQVTQSSGQVGSTTSIHIRGIGSMNASTEPLYVIDGVPVSQGDAGQMYGYTYSTNNVMSTLNPDDIESITVLKDAAASSLYGSRAANGVVVITTKKGKSGRPSINFKTSVSLSPSWATKNYSSASAEDQVAMEYEIFWDYRLQSGHTEAQANAYALKQINTGDRWKKHGYVITSEDTGRYTKLNIGVVDGAEKRLNKYYDWNSDLFKMGVYQTYDLSVSGGNDQTTYYSSIGYTKDKGRVIDNKFTRVSGRLNVNQKVGKFFEFSTNVDLGRTKTIGFNDSRSTSSNYFMASRNMLFPLYWPYYYDDETKPYLKFNGYCYNPNYYHDKWSNSSRTLKIRASETLTFHILPGLDAKTVFSYDNAETLDHYYVSAEHYNGAGTDGEVDEMTTNSNKMVSSSTVSYNTTFAEKHTISLLAGFEAEKNKTDFQRSTGTFLPSTVHTVATAGVVDANAYNWGNSLASVLSRAEYNYDNRYYASASFRRDGSSKLGKDNRWGNFWSVAGSWRITNEEFMKSAPWITSLKLRASYGVNGTLPSNNYGWRSLSAFTLKYQQNPGSIISTTADENLTWETNYTTNIALEFGLFDQRLYGTIEWFNRDSKDLLQDVPIPTVTGYSSKLQNIGKINNKGFEIELGGDIIRNKQITWSASVTASILKSQVKKLYGGEDILWSDPTGDDARANYIYREGQSTLAFWGREWAGVNPANGRQVWYINGSKEEEASFQDGVNGKFKYAGRWASYDYNDAYEKIIGNGVPKIYGGINTDVTWKNFTLGLNFIYKLGCWLYDGAEKDINDDGYYWTRTRSAFVAKNRWTHEGQKTTVPQIQGVDLTDAMIKSTRHLHHGDFLRLKTVTFGYNLPKNWISKVGLQNARVYCSGTNLLTWAAYREVDPETNQYSTRGWETPFCKVITFGLELGF
ncbi:MAG: TonB-dependent receptor [Bacteroidales bacterium]|jgi:TonB-linked SusC/RagA family outer membrane protein|nr:TonB-dependent receptor [Bacteroidales bacterium]MCI1733820.1 TonB-dependent receptor [Bacteroidales bacterium]